MLRRLRACFAATRPHDERGQVLSSVVAVAAVVAIVAGLLVLFGTRGNDSKADDEKPAAASTPKPSAGPSTVGASIPKPSEKPATSAPPPSATEPVRTTEPTQPTQTTQPTQPTVTTEPTTAPVKPPVTIPAEERPAIEVYNNTKRKGLADSVAGRARQAGWTVAGSPDNWHGKIAESTVYYPPGMLDAASQLARDLGIGRTKGALDNMKKDRLTVILTSDYSG